MGMKTGVGAEMTDCGPGERHADAQEAQAVRMERGKEQQLQGLH